MIDFCRNQLKLKNMINKNPFAEASVQYNLPNLLNEDRIYLDRSFKSPINGEQEINLCANFLKIGNVIVDGNIPLEIVDNVNGLIDLYKEATSLSKIGGYITGLKMIFGIDVDPIDPQKSKVCLLYQPVCMQKNSNIGNTNKVRLYDIHDGPDIYKYNDTNKTFTPIILDEVKKLVTNYTNVIQILHSDLPNDTHSDFIKGFDVESMIFPFQEIFALLYDNKPDEIIKISNCIKKNEIDPSFLIIKHSILLSVNTTTESASGTFKGMYANLIHLCPPHCRKGVYHLE
jgi:hypothetical protein